MRETKYKKKEKGKLSSSSSSSSTSDSETSQAKRKLEKLRRKFRKLKGETGKGKTFRAVGGGGGNMFPFATKTATREGMIAQSEVDISGTGWESGNVNTNVNTYGSVGYGGGEVRVSANTRVDGDVERISAAGKAKPKAKSNRFCEGVLPLGATSVNPTKLEGEENVSVAAQASINNGKYRNRLPPPSPTSLAPGPSKVPLREAISTNADANIHTHHVEPFATRTEADGTQPPAVPPKIPLQHHHNGGEELDKEPQNIHIHVESSSSSGEGAIPTSGP